MMNSKELVRRAINFEKPERLPFTGSMGLYSIPGRGEWVMNHENIPFMEYEKLASQFNPKHCDIRSCGAMTTGNCELEKIIFNIF